MKRRLFTILSALSLLLCLVSALLWVRTIWTEDLLMHKSSDSRSRVWVTSLRGRVGLGMQYSAIPPKSLPGGWHTFEANSDPGLKFFGFDVVLESSSYRRMIRFTVPHWFAIGVFAILPAIWVRRWRRLRASRKGLCLTCGYDLRASKDRCPECGTPCMAPPKSSNP